VFVLIFGAFLGVFDIVNNDSQTPQKVDIVMNKDGSYFELSGDFLTESDILSVSLTTDGRIAFSLSDRISAKYSDYYWWFVDDNHTAYTRSGSGLGYVPYAGLGIQKTEPVLYYNAQTLGEYDVSVECYVLKDSGYVCKATYSGTVTYVGEITEEYNWTYQGVPYSAQVSFSLIDYLNYKEMNTKGRAVTNYGNVISFITYNDPTIVELADSLKEAYGDRDTTGQDFAMFVLAFVQTCFEYPPSISGMGADMYQYGQNEYFAYPMEAIYYRMGDCEDTSILAAALFEALGYNAGVLILPGHAMAAVGLDSYSPGVYSHHLFEVISETVNGVTYYACETTAHPPGPIQGIGLVSLSGYNEKPYSSYVGKDGYNFYVV